MEEITHAVLQIAHSEAIALSATMQYSLHALADKLGIGAEELLLMVAP